MPTNTFNKLFFPHDGKPGHFKALDGLRGIAVLLVLLSHTSNVKLLFHKLLDFHHVGKVGVYLFFVLSAYLLDRQIALAFLTKKSTKEYWLNYFIRRFLRIYPLFFIALVVHGLFSLAGIKTVIDKLMDIPAHMALIAGESIFWSIPVEFKYYFISPLIIWVCYKYLKWDALKMACMFLALIVGAVIIEKIFKLPLVSTFRYLPIFMVGTVISVYEPLLGKERLSKVDLKIYNRIGVIALTAVLVTVPYYFVNIFGFKVNFHTSTYYLPYALLWGAVLISAKYGQGLVKRLLELKFLRFIGTISFSMYLFHILFIRIVKVSDVPPFLKIYVFFFLTIVFSSVTYLLIERPLSKVRLSFTTVGEKGLTKGPISVTVVQKASEKDKATKNLEET